MAHQCPVRRQWVNLERSHGWLTRGARPPHQCRSRPVPVPVGTRTRKGTASFSGNGIVSKVPDPGSSRTRLPSRTGRDPDDAIGANVEAPWATPQLRQRERFRLPGGRVIAEDAIALQLRHPDLPAWSGPKLIRNRATPSGREHRMARELHCFACLPDCGNLNQYFRVAREVAIYPRLAVFAHCDAVGILPNIGDGPCEPVVPGDLAWLAEDHPPVPCPIDFNGSGVGTGDGNLDPGPELGRRIQHVHDVGEHPGHDDVTGRRNREVVRKVLRYREQELADA